MPNESQPTEATPSGDLCVLAVKMAVLIWLRKNVRFERERSQKMRATHIGVYAA